MIGNVPPSNRPLRIATQTVGITNEEFIQTLIGRPLLDAERLATSRGLTVRVVSKDGQPIRGTSDIDPSRVNVTVKGDQVTGVAMAFPNVR